MISEPGYSVEIPYTYMLRPRLILMIQTYLYIYLLCIGDSLCFTFLVILILSSYDMFEMLIIIIYSHVSCYLV